MNVTLETIHNGKYKCLKPNHPKILLKKKILLVLSLVSVFPLHNNNNNKKVT